MTNQYWLAIAASPRLLNPDLTSSWWCLPADAKPNDKVLIYGTKSAGTKRRGIFAEADVLSVGDQECAQNSMCKSFGFGRFRYSEIAIVERFAFPLQPDRMRVDSVLRSANFVRRSFQGTTFRVPAPVYSRVRYLLKQQVEKGAEDDPTGSVRISLK